MRKRSRREFLALTGLVGAGAALYVRPRSAQAATHNGYPDALTHKIMSEIKTFRSWASGHGIFIGEVGIPTNLGSHRSTFYDQARWAALARNYYIPYANANRIPITWQECSERYYRMKIGGYYASIYLCPGDDIHKVVDRPGYAASVIEASAGRAALGIKFSEGQWFDESVQNNQNPGTYDVDYWYATVGSNPISPNTNMNSFQYLASRGIRHVRIGCRWERIQRTLGGPLDKTELGYLKEAVANANAAGLHVILDLHNFGGYVTPTGRKPIGSTGCTVSRFVDVWRRLSANFAGQVFAYDLMNEPYNHGGVVGGARGWQSYSQQVVNAIRARGDSTLIMVPTYSNVKNLLESHTSPWIKHGGSIRYTAHHYWDGHGGHFDYSYSYYNQLAAKRGY